MATDETWSKLRYFKPTGTIDQFGSPRAISDELMLKLDDFRHYVDTPVYVTAGVKLEGHKTNSYHYSRFDKQGRQLGACAVDVVVPGYRLTPLDLVFDALRFGFTGLGYYPHWRYKGRVVGGLHLDTRKLKYERDDTVDYRQSRWMGVVKTGEKTQSYVALSADNLMKYVGTKIVPINFDSKRSN